MKTMQSRFVLAAVLAAALTGCVLFTACSGGGGGGGGGGADGVGCTPHPTVFLRAEEFLMTLPDGSTVVMWGYAQDSSFGAMDGVLSSPGPQIQLGACATTLTIALDNDLAFPTSLVIDGLTTTMAPVRNANGRVRSFTKETPPANAAPVIYNFNHLRPGTFMYQSGTSPQWQVQMGLYGGIYQNLAPSVPYAGDTVDAQGLVVYSEIDPVIHHAVATNNFGAGKSVTSTIGYNQKYLLINGSTVSPSGCINTPLAANKKVLLRFVNAGLRTHVPNLIGARFNVLAEDGNPYANPSDIVALLLTAGKTMDAVVDVPPSGKVCALVDRMVRE